MPPHLRQFQKFNKIAYRKVSGFLYIKRDANCLVFFGVSGFLYIKRHVTQSVMLLYIYECQFKLNHEIA